MTGPRFARGIALALAAALFAASLAGAQAQDYPSRPVKVIVPFGAGGPADVTARQIGSILQESFGQPFVIENRTGAGGVIGTQEAVKSPPDGYTLLMMSNTQTANELLVPQRKYELMRDLAPIAPVNYSDLVIVVHPSVQAKTLQEFIALAKSQPGKLNYASSGQGTPYHMAGELFKAMAGIDVVHVPYRNSGEARSGVIGGQVQMMIDAVPAMAPNVAENQVRALATTGKTRSTVLPNAPTAIEAGVPGYEATIWLGLMAPAGTPKPIIDKLNAAVNAVGETARYRQALDPAGRGSDVDDPGGIRQIPARRYCEMGGSRQEIRQAAAIRSRKKGSPSMPSVRFRLNGAETEIDADPDRSLLDILRGQLGMTGPHFGCGAGECGACNVIIGDRAVSACDTPLWSVADKDVTTIEGLGTSERPHPLQRAFIAEQALQCGYCVSGILMSAAALLKRNPSPTSREVKEALDRNLCRCGSHNRMVRAVLRAAEEMAAG